MGGMAAQIPIRDDQLLNEAAMEKVRADKRREVSDGHDGTWVAHPRLVAIAKEVFDREMPLPNQIACKRQDIEVGAADLLTVLREPLPRRVYGRTSMSGSATSRPGCAVPVVCRFTI